jgi:hypothetical protein
MGRLIPFFVATVCGLVMPSSARAEILFESGATGPSVTDVLYHPVLGVQLLGWRFLVTEPVSVTGLGGHLLSNDGTRATLGSLVALTGPADVPDSFDRSTPDFLATTTLLATSPSSDVQGSIDPLQLAPGWYGLVYGDYAAGFGTYMVRGNPPLGSNTFFAAAHPDSAYYAWTVENDVRFFVVGVPEPATGIMSGAALLHCLRRRRRYI